METTINKRYWFYKDLNDFEEIEIRIEQVFNKWTPFKDMNINDFIYKNDIIHRSIMLSEIIIDLDKENIEDNKKLLLSFCELLTNNNLKYYVYYSGGKGFHIHFYFSDYFKYFTEENENQFLTLNINDRLTLVKVGILEFLGIDLNNIDLMIIETPRKLIRAEGSKHSKGYFKTFLGSDLQSINENLNNFQNSKTFILDNVKIKDKLNEITKEQHNYLITKLNKKMEQQIKTIRLNQFNKLKRFNNKSIRPIVQELFNKDISDGRKTILFIIIRELIGNEINVSEVKNIINKWNNLNHTKGALSDIYINAQIENALKSNIKPLRVATINKYLSEVKYK